MYNQLITDVKFECKWMIRKISKHFCLIVFIFGYLAGIGTLFIIN